MSHSCFISFKKEDAKWKDKIVEKLGSKRITGKSLDKWIDSNDLDYVMQTIRKDYMVATTVTIFLIGKHSFEDEHLDSQGHNNQSFIIRELQATLFDRKGNPRDGLLGVVLPEMVSTIFGSTSVCPRCGRQVQTVNISDETVIREFSANYWLTKNDCGDYNESGRYCVLVSYGDFMKNPDLFIDQAYEKTKAPISKEVHYKDLKHRGM